MMAKPDSTVQPGATKEGSGADGPYEFTPNETYKEETYSEAWKNHRSPEYFAYRKLWDEAPRNKRELDFPIHLDIETTNYCNLKCPMCPRTIMVDRGTFGEVGRMTREHYASIIDQATAHGVKSVKLNYLGEPMVHKDVVWQVEYAKKKGVLDVMMNSNATALTDKVARGLLAAGLDNLFISFDAISPDLFEQQRVGTSIGAVLDNAYNFIKLRNQGYPHVQVRISMVMYNEPKWLEQFEGLKTMWKGLVDAVGFGFYTERAPDVRGEYPEVPGFWCAQPFQRMFLKYNGNATVCCVDDKDEMVVGNWHKEPLLDIWRGEEFTRIRRLHAEEKYYSLPLCRKCYLPISE
jgi:Iron-sulfur cluster-binding domain/Radical SAM superfamily